MKITVFWDVTPYSLVNIYQCFRLICHLHLQVQEDSGSITSQKNVNFHNNCHENLQISECRKSELKADKVFVSVQVLWTAASTSMQNALLLEVLTPVTAICVRSLHCHRNASLVSNTFFYCVLYYLIFFMSLDRTDISRVKIKSVGFSVTCLMPMMGVQHDG
jgi:hypothetical protein